MYKEKLIEVAVEQGYYGIKTDRGIQLAQRWELRVRDRAEGSESGSRLARRQKSQEIAKGLSVSPTFAEVLVNRGIGSTEEARRFLSPRLDDLSSPFLLRDMEKAAKRIYRAVTHREKVLVYGDYDVDGITASVLVRNLLRLVDCECNCYIPDRLTEGYGLRANKIVDAHQAGVSLIITVDCGITSAAEVSLAKSLGIDVIVTDHHESGPKSFAAGAGESGLEFLPGAFAILNPKIRECVSDSGCALQFRELSGAGVAFKLCSAVLEMLSPSRKSSGEFQDYVLDALALSTLGSVADLVPLVGENRILVKFGLSALEASKSCGLRALLDMANLNGRTPCTEDIAYRIAPRLNAAGRMGRADLALNLLLSSSIQEAALLARELEKENRRRQKIEAETFQAAKEKALSTGAHQEPILFIWDESWHVGVTGIVATRLVEEFRRPAVLVALEQNKGRGAARSISDFDIRGLLSCCEDYFLAFGGHPFAAGFEVARENLETVRRIVLEAAQGCSVGKGHSTLEIDIEVPFDVFSISFARELERLRPYGEGNPEPVFATEGVKVVGRPKRIGRDGQHLCFFVSDSSRRNAMRTICYNMGSLQEIIEKANSTCSIAYTPYINQFQGQESVELKIEDIHVGGRSVVEGT